MAATPNYCSKCGVSIPEGETLCSVCAEDVDGKDGYYRRYQEEEAWKQKEEKDQEDEKRKPRK
jgi:uncharacterized Zn finger protein (UPF0148 family)